jgi:hypothetical protein
MGSQLPLCFYPKESRFGDIAKVQQELVVAPDSISIEDFRHCFQQWERHWDRCIQSLVGRVL